MIDFKHEEHKDESNAYLRSQTLINDNLPQKLLIRPEIRQIKPEQVIRIHGRPVNKVIELTLIDQDKSNEF